MKLYFKKLEEADQNESKIARENYKKIKDLSTQIKRASLSKVSHLAESAKKYLQNLKRLQELAKKYGNANLYEARCSGICELINIEFSANVNEEDILVIPTEEDDMKPVKVPQSDRAKRQLDKVREDQKLFYEKHTASTVSSTREEKVSIPFIVIFQQDFAELESGKPLYITTGASSLETINNNRGDRPSPFEPDELVACECPECKANVQEGKSPNYFLPKETPKRKPKRKIDVPPPSSDKALSGVNSNPVPGSGGPVPGSNAADPGSKTQSHPVIQSGEALSDPAPAELPVPPTHLDLVLDVFERLHSRIIALESI